MSAQDLRFGTTKGCGEVEKMSKEGFFQIVLETGEQHVVDTPEFTLGRIMKKPTAKYLGVSHVQSVSRKHLYISWNAERSEWRAQVLGKKCEINKTIHTKGSEVMLRDRTPIQIGDAKLFFLLPQLQQ